MYLIVFLFPAPEETLPGDVFTTHVLAKIKIFDEITEKSKFNYLSKELII